MKYHAAQFLLPLAQAIPVERAHSLVCLPDRATAEDQLAQIKREYGPRLIKAAIRKDRPPSRRGTPTAQGRGTYTLRYFTREAHTRPLF